MDEGANSEKPVFTTKLMISYSTEFCHKCALISFIATTLLTCTYCLPSYSHHFSPAHTACCHSIQTIFLHTLPTARPLALFSYTYCPPSYPPYSTYCYVLCNSLCTDSPPYTRHTLCTPFLYTLPGIYTNWINNMLPQQLICVCCTKYLC